MRLRDAILDDGPSGRVVPPSGMAARLTVLTSAAMAFLAVFALAASMAAGRLADRWSQDLAQTATVRISAPEGQVDAQVAAAVRILETTPGVSLVRVLTPEERSALLEPWFGPQLPLDALPIPQLIDVVETAEGVDAEGLRLRLAAEVPGAVFDDHNRWRRPLVRAADGLRLTAVGALVLIGLATAAMITLAAQAALADNGPVIRTLRLIGARDSFIARAFVRRFTLRSLGGAAIGTAMGMLVLLLLPPAQPEDGFLTGLGLQGSGWLLPILIPPLAALVAFVATRFAALRALRTLP